MGQKQEGKYRRAAMEALLLRKRGNIRISVPYAQKDPRFLFEKRRGQPREFWSLVSTIDGSTLPQVCVEEQLCS